MTADSGTGDKAGEPAYGGVVIAKWTSLRIPVGGLVLRATDDGTIEIDPVQVEVSLNMWPHRLDVALRHMKQADEMHKEVLAAHASKDSDAPPGSHRGVSGGSAGRRRRVHGRRALRGP